MQTGILKADALRSATGADVALMGMAEVNCYVPVGGTRSRLYEGPITEDDIIRISQNSADESPACCSASMTGTQLLALLNYGATSAEEQAAGRTSGFHPYAVSGVTLRYHLNGEAGLRVSDVRLDNGKAVDQEGDRIGGVLEGAVPEESLSDLQKEAYSITDVCLGFVAQNQNVAPERTRVSFEFPPK